VLLVQLQENQQEQVQVELELVDVPKMRLHHHWLNHAGAVIGFVFCVMYAVAHTHLLARESQMDIAQIGPRSPAPAVHAVLLLLHQRLLCAVVEAAV
jgi:uncharacterized membrane protein